METSMKDSFKMEIGKDREHTPGRTKVTTKANGWLTKWMVKVFTLTLKLSLKGISKTTTLLGRFSESWLIYDFILSISLRSRRSREQRCHTISFRSIPLCYKNVYWWSRGIRGTTWPWIHCGKCFQPAICRQRTSSLLHTYSGNWAAGSMVIANELCTPQY